MQAYAAGLNQSWTHDSNDCPGSVSWLSTKVTAFEGLLSTRVSSNS